MLLYCYLERVHRNFFCKQKSDAFVSKGTNLLSHLLIFDDFMEVWSPGELPEPITLEDLKKTHKSVPRNPLLARQLFWIKFVEEVGTGTNDLLDYCREGGIPEPEFKHVTGDFVVTFFGKLTDKYYEDLGLNERQIKAVKYVLK